MGPGSPGKQLACFPIAFLKHLAFRACERAPPRFGCRGAFVRRDAPAEAAAALSVSETLENYDKDVKRRASAKRDKLGKAPNN